MYIIPEIVNVSGAKILDKIHTVTFEHVYFSYQKDQNEVLKGISFEGKLGDKIGFSGESGTGKSTLLRLLLRFWNPTDGDIYINGRLIGEYDVNSLRKRIGMLEQETFLFNDTIAANIALGKPDASLEEIKKAAQMAEIDELISSLPDGYETAMGEMGERLSGGEKQRIGIARLLLYDPDVIVMDEPTSSLDAFTERGILETLKKHCDQKLLILVSHRSSTLADCERVYAIKEGKLSL